MRDSDVYDKPVPVQVVRHAAEQVANPTEMHREYVRELLAAMPQAVVDAAHEPYGARALIYASLLDRNADVRAAQLRALEQLAEPNVFELTLRLVPAVNQLDVRARLPLVDMTLPALRALSPSQYQEFTQVLRATGAGRQAAGPVRMDAAPDSAAAPAAAIRTGPAAADSCTTACSNWAEQCSVLLSTLARASQHDDDVAFEAGARHLAEVPVQLLPPEACGVGCPG